MMFYDPVYCDYMDSLCVVEPLLWIFRKKTPQNQFILLMIHMFT